MMKMVFIFQQIALNKPKIKLSTNSIFILIYYKDYK